VGEQVAVDVADDVLWRDYELQEGDDFVEFSTRRHHDGSVTVSLLDEELKHLWDAPVHIAALRWSV
jgi:hypothetical protein